MNNIKNIYQHAGKCDDQQNLKDIIGAAMVSNPEEIKDISPSLRIIQTTVKKPSTKKLICLFTNIFDFEKRTSKSRDGAIKPGQRSIRIGNIL